MMEDLFSVVAIEETLSDYMDDPTSPALTYNRLTWTEAVELARLSFRQGFRVVIWQTDGNTTGGVESGEECE